MRKTIDQYFYYWESHVFGYSHGTGEKYIIPELQKFMSIIPEVESYDYKEIEKNMSPLITWLFINILCHANIFEYGTSTRYAWLTECGKVLKNYLLNKTYPEDFPIFDEDYTFCYPDACRSIRVKKVIYDKL